MPEAPRREDTDAETAVVGGPAPGGAIAAVDVGATVGRYLVIEELGRGGMGVVLRAYDPRLSREVALKILRADRLDAQARPRLIREAQAMAQLSHPNVVAVYDVEETGDRVVLAMEYVSGGTLQQWLSDERDPDRIVDAFVQAGHGLVAAHEVGLLHRDFKPANVLVGEDGRVRVTDFGLARTEVATDTGATASRDGAPPHVSPAEGASIDSLSGQLTEAGTVMGTPRYMAPEQHLGQELTTAVDQYSFCVALWEALAGAPPFTGPDAATDKCEGPPAWPSSSVVSRTIVEAIRRGLAAAPSDRWPSLRALLDALERARTLRRSRRRLMLVGSVGVVAALGLGARQWDEARRRADCDERGHRIDEAWNGDARERIAAAIGATGAAGAKATAERLMPWLDEHAAQWRATATEVCLDAEVRNQWDRDTTERAQWCLDERREELAALVARLGDGDPEAVRGAVSAAAGLSPVAPCADATRLRRLPIPPRGPQREELEALRAELSRIRARWVTGARKEATEASRAAVRRAEALNWPPMHAKSLVLLGLLLNADAAYDEAESTLERAYFVAITAGEPEVALSAATELTFLVGFNRARHDEGLRWSRHAEVLLAQLPDPVGLRHAMTLTDVAGVYRAAGRLEEALAAYQQALEIRRAALPPDHPRLGSSVNNVASVLYMTNDYEAAAERFAEAVEIRRRALGPDHPDTGQSLSNLAATVASMGDTDRAAKLYEEALGIRRRALGPRHPDVAETLNNYGNLRNAIGDYDAAIELRRQAAEIREEALGPDHPMVASSLNNLANTYERSGRYEEAARLHERALEIRTRVLEPDHPDIAASLNNLANVYTARDDLERARRMHERALEIRERKLGPDHGDVATSLTNLAAVDEKAGDLDAARPRYERALTIWTAELGPGHRLVAYPLLGLARIALAQRDAPAALAWAERALTIRTENDVSAKDRAEARFLVARVLGELGRDPVRATELATQARDAYRQLDGAQALTEVEAWLAARK